MVRLVNSSDRVLSTDEFGGLEVQPGGECEIADGYCDARLSSNGTRIPSIVERIARVLVPVDPEVRATWGQHLRISAVSTEPEAAKLAAEGMPPAVTALVANGTVDPPKRRRRGV